MKKRLNEKKHKRAKSVGFSSITAQDNFTEGMAITPHASPIYTSSTYVYESAEAAKRVFSGEEDAFIYSRWSHPNAELVERKMEQLETFQLEVDAKALVFSSGMSALSALFQSLLKPGDAVLAQGNIYGTAIDYFNHFGQQLGIEIIYADFADFDAMDSIFRKKKNIRLVYAETPSNPTLKCYDLKTLGKMAKQFKAKLAVDNTFASPYLQQPLHFGADYVIHSSTKYLNGHGTGLSGFIVGRDVDFMKSEVWKIRKLTGSICAPFDSWLLNIGMKTLSLRMNQHCGNALVVAKFLQQHQAVASVNYLGLKEHPGYNLAKKQMQNFGGVLSFSLKGGYKAGKKLMQRIRFCKLTASLGTIDTLIQHPASMSHSFVPKAQREQYGITDGLIRLSVGIEDVQDIILDLDQAIQK